MITLYGLEEAQKEALFIKAKKCPPSTGCDNCQFNSPLIDCTEMCFYDPIGVLQSITGKEYEIQEKQETERYGKWINKQVENVWCSVCHRHPLEQMAVDTLYYWWYEPKYCPNCGAKMDLKE